MNSDVQQVIGPASLLPCQPSLGFTPCLLPAGLVSLPMEFRSKLCLLLFINLGVSWLADGFGGWLFERLKGRRLCGATVA